METINGPPVDVGWLAQQIRVLAEPRRLQILHLLMEGVQCNCDLGEALGMAPNLVSHHLRVLQKAGLIHMERDALDARWVYYSPNPVALEALCRGIGAFLDPSRIKPRRHTCGPQDRTVS